METTMQAFERMLRERYEHYQELWNKNSDDWSLVCAQVYQGVIDMFQYAKENDRAGLAQFDYFGKD